MNSTDLVRLQKIDERIREIAEEEGLLTTDVTFEVGSSHRMIEAMAYNFPTNYSHWSFGRDFERHRTIYEHFGAGIPYEVVWNFEKPRAFLVETNPFALNVTILAHVYGHVDFFLGSNYLKRGRVFTDIAEEAYYAAERFADYERKYGKEVESVITAAMTIQWHQDPDPFADELDEEDLRKRLVDQEQARLLKKQREDEFKKAPSLTEIEEIEKNLRRLETHTPPEPTYDLLWYIIQRSPKPLKPWAKDVLKVIRNQARHLAVQRRTKILNEGWATYWHTRIMRRLWEERLITKEEHGVFNTFNSNVVKKSETRINPYALGLALYEYVKEAWDKGRFGPAYEACEDPYLKARWDTGAGKGTEKIFQIRSSFSDRMAVETLFTPDFIRQQELFIYERFKKNPSGPLTIIADDTPKQIRALLLGAMTHYGIAQISVESGNYGSQGVLYLRHHETGFELDPAWRDRTLSYIRFLWGRNVLLEAPEEGKLKVFTVNAKGEVTSKDF